MENEGRLVPDEDQTRLVVLRLPGPASPAQTDDPHQGSGPAAGSGGCSATDPPIPPTCLADEQGLSRDSSVHPSIRPGSCCVWTQSQPAGLWEYPAAAAESPNSSTATGATHPPGAPRLAADRSEGLVNSQFS